MDIHSLIDLRSASGNLNDYARHLLLIKDPSIFIEDLKFFTQQIIQNFLILIQKHSTEQPIVIEVATLKQKIINELKKELNLFGINL